MKTSQFLAIVMLCATTYGAALPEMANNERAIGDNIEALNKRVAENDVAIKKRDEENSVNAIEDYIGGFDLSGPCTNC